MKNLLRNSLAKKLILTAFVMGLVSTSAMAAYQIGPVGSVSSIKPVISPAALATLAPTTSAQVSAVAPIVSNLNVTPSTGSASIAFSLNTTAYTTIWIKDMSDTIVKTVIFDNNLTAGTYSYTWNGTDNNNAAVTSGNYKAQVAVYNTASQDAKSYTFNFTGNGGGGTVTAPVVSVSVAPTSFDPTKGQSTTVSYSSNASASVGVVVKQNGSVVKTLRASSVQPAGSYTLTWNGLSDSGVTMAPNTYTVEVNAVNTAGTDTKTASVTIANDSTSVTAPNITNVYGTPTPFNPNSENTRIYFTLDKTATVSVDVLDTNSNSIRNLANGTSLTAGTYYYEWNGRNSSGNLVNDGTYRVRVNASNTAGSDTEYASVEVKTSTNGGSCDLVTSDYANPSTFNPNNDSSLIYYTLSRTADVTVRIKDGSSTVRTLVDNDSLTSGSKISSWNGRDQDGDFVSNGTYTYEIRASVSGCSDDIETGSVYVTGSTDGGYDNDWPSTNEDLVRNLTVDPEIFQPLDGERATVRFNLSRSAELRVQILDGSRIVKSLRDTGSSKQSSGDYSYTWDGRDSSGHLVSDKVYQVRVMADDGNDTDTDRAFVELDTDGIIIGFDENDRCAGFRDVSKYSPFCKAIELMSKKRIFDGYSDGTFRPYEKINRAETAKVVVLALNYDVDTNGYFSKQYKDTVANAWYTPYLEVARRNDIATGYPDGTFRPASTINRVELLRIFLEGNRLSLSSCSPQPFDDTPISKDTDWYMKYACYAKYNGLMNSEYSNKLFPADAMTRGDVADLFYDFEVKGLYSQYDQNGYYYDNYTDPNNDRYCVSYDRYGTCTQYQYNSNSNPANRTCVARNSYGDCTRWEYDTYSYNNGDGYYVYRNGQYVWVSY